ncbi:hypothetical protein FRC01_000314 [Tulasnella sp. 417]|nr:hypothetical protein FRC01_000314 [Tulasnella sp. 417]
MDTRDPSFEEEDPLPGESKQTHPPTPILAPVPESVSPRIRYGTETAITATPEQHNASPPVNNLPTELLVAILQIGLEDARSTRIFLASVLYVCRRWNQVVLASPTLWTRFELSDGADYWNSNYLEYLKRTVIQSRSLGLKLSCYIPDEEEALYSRLLYVELGRCMSRWQDVKFEMGWKPGPFFAALPKLGNNTAPKLRNLYLSSNGYPEPCDIFDPHDPCPLERLELYHTAVVWSTVNFERLRYLYVGEQYGYPPSVPELLRIFERSPRLEYLWLYEMELAPGSPNLPMPSEPVCLPRLSRFSMPFLHTADTLIRMMRFPSCQYVVCETSISGPDSISSLAHVAHAMEKAITVTDTTLSLGTDKFSVHSNGTMDNRHFYFEIRGEPEAILHWFINIARAALIASPAVRLSLRSNFSYDKTMRIITELGDLKNITALHFQGGQPSGSHCNPLDCLDNLGDQIQQSFPRLLRLKCSVNNMSDLGLLHRVVLRLHPAIASKEQAHLYPLQTVVMIRNYDWDPRFQQSEDQLEKMASLIPGVSFSVNFEDPEDF